MAFRKALDAKALEEMVDKLLTFLKEWQIENLQVDFKNYEDDKVKDENTLVISIKPKTTN